MFALYRRRRRETRTRKDRINQRNDGFERQLPAMVDEYMLWKEKLGDKGMSEGTTSSNSEGVEGTMRLHVIDVFRKFLISTFSLFLIPLTRGIFIRSRALRH